MKTNSKKRAGQSVSRNNPVWVCPETLKTSSTKVPGWIYFPSQYEKRVYCQLLSLPSWISVELRPEIIFKPQTSNYPALTWICDFRITSEYRPYRSLTIEAKGDWIFQDSKYLAEFRHKIQFLEYFHKSEWRDLLIVCESGEKLDPIVHSTNLEDLKIKIFALLSE